MSSPAAGAVLALARTPAAAARYDLTPRATVLCSVLALAAITWLDLIDGRLGFAYSLGFAMVVLSAAAAVQERGFFMTGVLPPALLVGSLFVIAALTPDAIVIGGLPESTGLLGLTLAATIDHAIVLLIGHALAMAMILGRIFSTHR